MNNHLKARPTTYKGIRMRSRLEALFAAHLDSRHKTWQYEPRAYGNEHGQYLPDFQLGSAYIEIKPETADHDAALERMHVILDSEPHAHLTVFTRTRSGWVETASCTGVEGIGTCTCQRRRLTIPT